MGSSLLNSKLHQVLVLLFTKSMVVRHFGILIVGDGEGVEGTYVYMYVYEEGEAPANIVS